MNCIFCEIYREGTGIIFENRYFFAIFDRYPVSPGHAEIIPKRHVVSLLDLTDEEWRHLKPAIEGVIKVIETTNLKEVYTTFIEKPINGKSKWFCERMLRHGGIERKPDGYNIGVNEGEAAGRTIDHLHIHIIPRYAGDVSDPVGGIRHVIPELANYRRSLSKRIKILKSSIFILLFALMLIAGILMGEPSEVLRKAVRICLSCIGIG